MADRGQLKILDTIQGSSFLAIRSAMAVLQRRNLNVQLYRIALLRDESSFVVLFTRMDEKRDDIPRNLGVLQGSDAELNSEDLRSYLSKMDQLKTLDAIQGKSFLAIQVAAAVFQQHNNPDLARYKIAVVREGDSVFVTFTDKDGKPGARGASGTLPGFEVELTARDLQVLRSHFVR
jgi:hypothetical protein